MAGPEGKDEDDDKHDEDNASAKGGKRLRLSVIDFISGFTNPNLPVTLNTPALDAFQTCRFDDYTLVNCIFFTAADSNHNAKPPNFTDLFQVRGQKTRSARIDYLKKLTTEMHNRKVQVIVGYTLDEGGNSTDPGKNFNKWLAAADDAKVTVHAQQIVDFFFKPSNPSDKVEIDGISFDFEINGLGLDTNHAPRLKTLITATATAINNARPGASVSYDNTPFETKDGDNSNSFFRIQPYSVAAGTTNIIARPMHNLKTAASKPTIQKTIAVALDTGSSGGKLAPQNLQIMLNVDQTGATTVADICTTVLQPKRIGLVLFRMGARSLAEASMQAFAKDVQTIETALNPAASGPGKKDKPVQAPLGADLP